MSQGETPSWGVRGEFVWQGLFFIRSVFRQMGRFLLPFPLNAFDFGRGKIAWRTGKIFGTFSNYSSWRKFETGWYVGKSSILWRKRACSRKSRWSPEPWDWQKIILWLIVFSSDFDLDFFLLILKIIKKNINAEDFSSLIVWTCRMSRQFVFVSRLKPQCATHSILWRLTAKRSGTKGYSLQKKLYTVIHKWGNAKPTQW